ncbi:MAG: GNAT family N-acetyltransferase, partial [Myxococcota bacterium]|nr:GNAT family N-acetyltransferase [Myxococcota bacterium]
AESTAELAALEPEWRGLERTSGNTLPFRTFTWTAMWWRHMHQDRASLRDSLAIRTVRTVDRRLVGVAPFMLTERPAVGPVRARCLQFVGADPNVTEVRGLLSEPSREAACYAAIGRDLAQAQRDVDWVRWSGVDSRSGGREVLRPLAVDWDRPVVCSLLELPGTWEELKASRPHNLKESLRKCYNSLKRAGLEYSLEVVREPDRVESALADFLRLHAARAALDGTVQHKNVFERAQSRAFLLDVCRSFAEQGALRIFRLHVGGVLAATRIGFVLADSLYLYYSGFDPAFAKYSVMTTSVAEAIKYAIGERLGWVNLSTGEDVSKTRWRPLEIGFHEGVVLSPGVVGRAKYRMIAAARRVVLKPKLQQYAQVLLAR